MNGNLGRDKVWTPDIWADIDKAVTAEVGQVRVAQKVFPSTQMPNVQSVPADRFDPDTMSIAEGQTKPLIEISVEFSLTQSQVDSESTLHTGQKLARLAAKTVALAEDGLLFRGQDATLPDTVRVVNRAAAERGLVAAAATQIEVDRNAKNYPALIFQAVVQGISQVTSQGQPGPYGLFLENSVYADAHRPEPQSLVTPSDRIMPLVTGGFFPTGTLLVAAGGGEGAGAHGAGAHDGRHRLGLLASQGGEPVSIYIAVDAITAFTQADQDGILRFRVFERVQYVARDPRALYRLVFTN
jgi:uncharacterized linocin/CFP29 family protein